MLRPGSCTFQAQSSGSPKPVDLPIEVLNVDVSTPSTYTEPSTFLMM